MLNVQFSDGTQSTIVSYFASPQDSSVFANLGEVDASDARWAAFYESLPELARSGMPVPTK
ncbi:hypothetical protein BKK79_36090 [Cupriavidus sp. USMAA2-4]|uniref:Uncharacterized protein n=1 Tax=Cupriavidus malaysiensis TaxID=367825 RepID=A0ABM6F5B9_9BURK|nr:MULTISPECIES: hypothetical protein [Cupriavidus]AOY96839.1 hypothetical protein BKK79_35685 [Cupriavidus sp. USMAA2-4]AOY96914.1 hypothetical protein BKK79_36090 [Cupriavidus sp. USMAA2-4]AOZ06689.1 hypothetical protein BKK80_13355 [Cupriavidus malaysiensis]